MRFLLAKQNVIVLLLCMMVMGTAITFAQSSPTITAIEPNQGYSNSITNVEIRGSGFYGEPTVKLGDTEIQDVTLLNSTTLFAVVQAGLSVGTYNVTVTNPDNSSATLNAGFTVYSPTPDPRLLLPDRGRSDLPNEIYIYGFNFVPGVEVRLADNSSPIPLATTRTSSTRLKAVVPPNLPAGVYSVQIANPGESVATLADAYTVYDVVNDDLFGNSYELWTEPVAIRAGGSGNGIGLIVHRQGGKQPVSVTVRFYEGDPDNGGILLGDGTIALLSPRSSQSTSKVAWNPTSAGTYELYAVIDPDNRVPEALESNNKVHRTVTVLPPVADLVAPRVDNFVIDEGNGVTTDDVIQLDTVASDPTPGSGVAALFFQEFEYSQGAGQWVPVQSSDWVDYAAANTDYPWTLMPNAGVKYLQAWAADAAGNISVFPFRGFVSYIPPTDRVGMDQSRIYRYTLQQGERLTARVEVISGDPDLYVWTPNPDAPPYVSNLSGTVTDEVSFSADQSGLYQVEVYGYSAAEYRLTVTIETAAQGRSVAPANVAGVDNDKPLPTQPALSLSSAPATQTAVTAPPVTDTTTPSEPTSTSIYLPAIVR